MRAHYGLVVLLLLLVSLSSIMVAANDAADAIDTTQQQQQHQQQEQEQTQQHVDDNSHVGGGEADTTLQAPSHKDIDNKRHNNRHSDRGDAVRSHGIFVAAAAASTAKHDDTAAAASSSSSSSTFSKCERAVHDYLARLYDTTGTLSQTAHDAKEAFAHARKGDASVVADAGHVVQRAVHALKSTEAEAKALLGRGVPQVCIDEVQNYVNALPDIASKNEMVRTWARYYRTLAAHGRTFYLVMRGIARYTLLSTSHNPVLRAVQSVTDTYTRKAQTLHDELKADTGLRGVLHKAGDNHAIRPMRLKKQALAAVYAAVPYVVYAAGAVAAVVAAPLVLLYAVFGHGFYHTWLKLFVLFYHYGHASPLRAVRSLGHVAQQFASGDWAGASSTAMNAFLGLAGGADKSFYSGYLMLFVLAWAAVATVVVALLWWRGVRGVWRRLQRGAGVYAATTAAADDDDARRSRNSTDNDDSQQSRRSGGGGGGRGSGANVSSNTASQRPSRASTEKKRS